MHVASGSGRGGFPLRQVVDHDEFRKTITELGFDLSDEAWKKLVKFVDREKRGFVEYNDLVRSEP